MNLEDVLNTASLELDVIANVEVTNPLFYDVPSLKIGPRHYYHHGSFCHFAKLHGNQDACHLHKRKSVILALHGKAFHGCCPYGIWDYVQPVRLDRKLLAVVYLGHFKTQAKPLLTINGQTYDGPALTTITDQKISDIQSRATFIKQFILYACAAAQANGYERRKHRSAPRYQRICMEYIRNHYHQPVRLMDLAKMLDVNSNYLGQLIQKQTGKTFRQMLTEYRIAQAKVHLGSESLPITQVAYTCGFQDSNYFATVFYEHTGMTPTQWREEHPTIPMPYTEEDLPRLPREMREAGHADQNV